MNDILDTLINIEIFCFIGVLVWLYLKPASVEPARPQEQALDSEPE